MSPSEKLEEIAEALRAYVELAAHLDAGAESARRALTLVREMRANAVEGYASRVGDQCWPDFRADDKHTGYAFHEPALLITTPREER